MSNEMDSIDDLVEGYICKAYGSAGVYSQLHKEKTLSYTLPVLKTLNGEVLSTKAFFHAASILLSRPSAYNRAVFSTSKTLRDRLHITFKEKDPLLLDLQCKYDIHQDLGKKMANPLTLSDYDAVTAYAERISLIRKVLLREMRGESDIFETWDFKERLVRFFPIKRFLDDKLLSPKGFPALFCELQVIEHAEGMYVAQLTLRGDPDNSSDTFWTENYSEHIFPKFLKWANTEPKKFADPGPTISLQVICHDTYQKIYKEMKDKYMAKVFKIWENAKEKTDPSKFVPEDIAIASYIQILQQTEGFKFDKRFVDLGCGNGLLTYLLRSEGWKGIGLDMRRRRIWDFFPDMGKSLTAVDLMASSFNIENCANSRTLLIGNHPDQLTPWIPILGNSKGCPFIIIPCCAYDWTGKYERYKFDDMDEVGSVYQNYMHSTITLAKKCGYECTVDRLRIPSTKKLAIIGIHKYRDVFFRDVRGMRLEIEFCRSQHLGQASSKSRKSAEKSMAVKNCTSLPIDEVEAVITKILFLLLDNALVSDENFKHENGITWNRGNQTTALSDLVKGLGPERMKLLKSQNKGLQTLLRNHKYIFNLEDGFIRLRVPISAEKARIMNINPSVYKKKHCFFDKHHPDHCPLPFEQCSYRHRCEPDEQSDLSSALNGLAAQVAEG